MVATKDRHSGYWEAILQLRPPTDEIMRFIKNQMKKRPAVAITKVQEQKTGVDLYFTSQKFTRGLGPKLKKAFGGVLIISKKLHTRDRQTSRDLFRATVLFRPRIIEKPEEEEEAKDL